MLKPKRLRSGSNVAIVSPSNGNPYRFPGIYGLGLQNLRELGLNVVEYPTARMSPEALYRHPELRAKDLNDAFADERIDGIITSIGGYESVRILRYLDVEKILGSPKLIMGFSDSTAFLTFLSQLGLVTFYGPSVMAGFAQLGSLPASFAEHIKSFLFDGFEAYSYRPYPRWTNGYRDWSDQSTLGQCTEFYGNEGWSFLQGERAAEGVLWGGCIEVLEFLKSTQYYPQPDFWNGKILFFETSEEKPLPRHIGYMLRNYGVQGVLNKIGGVMFGRPKDYSQEEKSELKKIILDIFNVECGVSDIPIVFNADFGHTDPKLILPLGCSVRLDPAENSVTLMDNPFAPD